ncbi:MAG: hypothetical protein KatS3mg058_3980 [Roseiflexus sp.]|nr:MAG: hypothetical protein KatS3mg058_3980 [Roseiflexus sp.]
MGGQEEAGENMRVARRARCIAPLQHACAERTRHALAHRPCATTQRAMLPKWRDKGFGYTSNPRASRKSITVICVQRKPSI